VANENPQDLYDQVRNKIYPEINGRGRLYKTIQIIVGEEQSHEQEKTKKICDYFGIKYDANKEEDKEIINDLLGRILKNTSIDNVIATIAKVINKGVNMEWIVVAAAFTFVGLFLYKQTLDKKEQAKIKPAVQEIKYQPIFQPPSPADLCLVVPASIASNFINRSNLRIEEVTYLIDNAYYFLCTTVKVPDSKNDEYLKTTDETILPDSRREVYIRININDGGNMIDKKIPYYLKTNLPPQAQCVIKQLACLENLSGLEKFNRI
jgi:phosphoribosylformylglycinamidine (FGAM) synthase PurS component